jgi:hypothetical protein
LSSERDDYAKARAWLTKHGQEHRSKVGDGYRVMVSAYGAGAEVLVADDDPEAEYRRAFTRAVKDRRTKLGPFGS